MTPEQEEIKRSAYFVADSEGWAAEYEDLIKQRGWLIERLRSATAVTAPNEHPNSYYAERGIEVPVPMWVQLQSELKLTIDALEERLQRLRDKMGDQV